MTKAFKPGYYYFEFGGIRNEDMFYIVYPDRTFCFYGTGTSVPYAWLVGENFGCSYSQRSATYLGPL